MKFLLDEGLSAEGEALYAAAGAGHLAVCELLLERGAGLNGPSHSFVPLLNAVEGNRMAVVKLLLDSGADVEVENNQGWSPLGKAFYWGAKYQSLGETDTRWKSNPPP